MKARALLPLLASVALVAPLGGCVSQPVRMTHHEASPVKVCDQVTGSRIHHRQNGECQSAGYPFMSFTAEQLQATGQFGIGDALRQVSPAFR